MVNLVVGLKIKNYGVFYNRTVKGEPKKRYQKSAAYNLSITTNLLMGLG
jgi:hypothetical protein